MEEAKMIGKLGRRSKHQDHIARLRRTSEEIESELADGNSKGAYQILSGWYREKAKKPLKPTPEEAAAQRQERILLYAKRDPPGAPIPIHLAQPFTVKDEIPDEEEIIDTLMSMKLGKSPGASGIRVENLRCWLKMAQREEEPDRTLWEKVVQIVKLAYSGADIPQTFVIGVLVLIPKGDGNQRGIALLETIYKLISAMINRRLLTGIEFHDSLHGFRKNRGTGTAIIEAKLKMQLVRRGTAPFYWVFMDLTKAYDTLDRGRTMEILKGYGVGPIMRSFINQIWDGDTMVTKQGGYFGKPFGADQGVRQGDPNSSPIFNIVVDAVIRYWHHTMEERHPEMEIETVAQFYADDGLVGDHDKDIVQESVNILKGGFEQAGMNTNVVKTKSMCMPGGRVSGELSLEAKQRRATGTGKTHRERMATKVDCNLCGRPVNKAYLSQHQETKICKDTRVGYSPQRESELGSSESLSDPLEPTESQVFNVAFDKRTDSVSCPVPGCQQHCATLLVLKRHFMLAHWCHEIKENGNRLERCPKCLMMMQKVTSSHQDTWNCMKGQTAIMKREEKVIQQKAVEEVVFTIDGTPIENVEEFLYLGRILQNKDDDGPTVRRNLRRARNRWAQLRHLLTREGANPRVMASFYKAIVQAVLLYGSESWVLSERHWKDLRSFHNRCARHITGMHIRKNQDGTFTFPKTEEVLREAGLWSIEEYIQRRKDTIEKFAHGRPIYQQCIESTTLASNPNQLVWWE
jgi:hypothetical protein